MHVARLDHFVLTVADINSTIRFYTEVLGMQAQTFGGGRQALRFGDSKINLHQVGHEFEPKAVHPTPGSADLCLIVDDPLEAVIEHLNAHGEQLSKDLCSAPARLAPSAASTYVTATPIWSNYPIT